jgi:HEAT repeat protein/beta-lactamase regulating signal transducer with metallopeptidase domain
MPCSLLCFERLADAVAKTTLILLAAGAASIVLRRASAALRHLIWTLALSSALFLPIASLALPKWQLPLVTITAPASTTTPVAPEADASLPADTNPEETAPAPTDTNPRSVASGFSRKDAAGVQTAPDVRGATHVPSPSSAPQVAARASIFADLSWQQILAAIWLIGATAILGRILVGLVAVRWLSTRTQEITDAAWLPMAQEMARDMGVSARVRFLRSGRASMPVAAGIFRPAVIMPTDADTWSEGRLRIVLLHELAHVKRRDCLTHMLGQAACAFHWFNPLAWLAVKRARTERERACDDLVLARGTRGSDYADQLLEMARALRGDRFPALLGGASLAMAHRSQLEGRLIAILDPRVPRSGLTRGRAFAAVALCSAAVAPLGALQPWTTEATSPVPVLIDQGSGAGLALPPPPAVPDRRDRQERSDVPRAAAELQNGRPAVAPANPANREDDVDNDAGHEAAHPHPAPVPQPMPMPHSVVSEAIAAGQAIGEGVAGGIVGGVAGGVAGGVVVGVEGVLVDTLPFAMAQEPKPVAPGEKAEKPADKAGTRADPRMIAALTAALKDPDKEVRETAMHALVQMRDPSIFEPLLQALKDGSPDVREQAAFGLGQMRDKRAVQPLIAAAKDENADVREQAVFALGQLRDPAAVDGIAAAVKDVNADVREQAVFALGQLRDRRAVDPLISALKDTSPDVREQAAFALGQIRDARAVDALVVAVKDPNKDVREQVVFALGQIRDPRAIDALTTALKDQNAEVRKQAAFALGQLAR